MMAVKTVHICLHSKPNKSKTPLDKREVERENRIIIKQGFVPLSEQRAMCLYQYENILQIKGGVALHTHI